MKHIISTVLLILTTLGIQAQNVNRLYIPDMEVMAGTTIQIPICLENTNPDIVAAQFKVVFPEQLEIHATPVQTERLSGHTIQMKKHTDGWLMMVYSAENTPFRGNSGALFTIEATVPSTLSPDTLMTCTKVSAFLSDSLGNNVLTEASVGTIRIAPAPDFTVTDILSEVEEVQPSGMLPLSWLVKNQGKAATRAGWTEDIYLVDEAENDILIATFHQTDIIAADGSVGRNADITLPLLLGMSGNVHVKVKITPNADAGEPSIYMGNNSSLSSQSIHVAKKLILEIPNRSNEGNKTLPCRLFRSGSWEQAESFSLHLQGDARLSVPAQIQIEAGQSGASFYLDLQNDDVLNDDSLFVITASGNGYPETSETLIVVDDELPDLYVESSKSVVEEGDVFQLTISTNRAMPTPTTVTLTCELPQRFEYPASVVLPAGETSVVVDVTAVDDEIPNPELSNAFIVSASGYNRGEAIVILQDNDMPVLEMTFSSEVVSEGDGAVAVSGVLRRTTNKNIRITVHLTDDADGGLYFGNRTLELAKGVDEVHFNFGPTDNMLVDGDRVYTVTASVYMSSCSCSAVGESAGTVSAQLRVLDNDGPTLALTSALSTVKEGGQTSLTVSRNTSTEEPLVVTLTSDLDEHLVYEHAVTIPAGQSSVEVLVTSLSNDIQNDSHTVVFTAQSEGFNTGVCYLMITDQTLPDARISNIMVDNSEVVVGGTALLTVEVLNDGAAELPSETPVSIYCRGNNTPVSTLYTSHSMAVGATETLVKTLTLPAQIGTYHYYAVVNPNNVTKELSYTNNTSIEVAVKTVSPYTAQVSTDKQVYGQGAPVLITGQLTGDGIANTPVDIYLINNGSRQVLNVTTDADGAFSKEWTPYAMQSGHFVVGACYPDEGLKTSMATFDVYGLQRVDNGFITHEIRLDETLIGNVSLLNPTTLGLTGVKAEIVSSPSNYEVELSMPTAIEGGQTVQLNYSIRGTAVTVGDDWEEIPVRVTSSEGITLQFTIYVFCRNKSALLVCDRQELNVSVTKGSTRDYSLQLVNKGGGNTGDISFSLPEFITCESGKTMASLSPNDTTNVILRIHTTEQMELNLPVTGTLRIGCANGNTLSLNYSVEAVSEENGSLVVDVCDEYTYNTVEAPHVSGATVVVSHPFTGAQIAQGTTGEDGKYSVELPAGYYHVEVTADKHKTYSNYYYVNPGKTEYARINLSYQPITISWNVVETEVEDEYQIVTTVKYETNVPMPVVKITLPKSIDGDNMAVGDATIITMTLTNVGLIRADNVRVILPTDMTEWKFEALGVPDSLTLNAQQAIQIPIRITRIADESHASSRMAKNFANDMVNDYRNCMAGLAAYYEWLCGDELKNNAAAERMAMKVCAMSATMQAVAGLFDRIFGHIFGGGSLGKPGGGGYAGGGSGSGDGGVYNGITKTLDICDPCDAARVEKLIDTLVGYTWLGSFNSTLSSIIEEYQSNKDVTLRFVVRSQTEEFAKELTLEEFNKFREGAGTLVGYIIDVYELATVCSDIDQDANASRGTRRKASTHSWATEFDEIALRYVKQLKAMDQLLLYSFGDRIWYDEVDEGKVRFLSYVDSLEEDYIPTDEELLARKPETATLSQMRDLIDYLHGTGKALPTREEVEEQFDIFKEIDDEAKASGFASMTERFQDAYETYQAHFDELKSSVCASITLQFAQTMTMTRQAFLGTLTVYNGHGTTAMENVRLQLEVRNVETGQIATSHEFQINAKSLKGFGGELDLTSGWTLNADATGVATVEFIPTKYAAPTTPQAYSFGGALVYIDPYTGLEVTRKLYPLILTVNPSPELDLIYFMQRDIFGDDALTEKVEPMVPAEFALLINNKGNGDATKVRMLTQQPEIIDNEKGLLINFELISSQVNGGEKTLSFSQSIPNDFGTIPAHSQTYAQWWLQSSLLGHFTDYNITATHVTSYGNEDLSLLDEVSIHELIHGFTVNVAEGNPLRGFLVNEIVDSDDQPDTLFLSDATQRKVYMATGAVMTRQSDTEYLLTVTPSEEGWNYVRVTDKTGGRQQLLSIIRQSDGAELPVDNIWQTDRTLRDGNEPIYEDCLHFIGDVNSGGETYLLTFTEKPVVELEVESFEGLPEEGSVLNTQLTSLVVKFNKPVDSSTFTSEDLTLFCQGVTVDVSAVGIERIDSVTYRLNLSLVTYEDGYYVLTVQTAGIVDMEGFHGATGKQAAWTQFVEDVVHVVLEETATEVPESVANAHVTLKRKIQGGVWNTLVLPFDMTPDLVERVFGSGTRIAEFSHYDLVGDKAKLRFTVASEGVVANTPCLIFVEQGDTIYEIWGVTLDVANELMVTHGDYSFIGTYVTGAKVPVGDFYINNNVFFESRGLSTIKGFRAYIHCSLPPESRPVGLFFDVEDDSETTGIRSVGYQRESLSDSPFYDLHGRRVLRVSDRQLSKGIYIQNGRKHVVK